MAIMPHDWLNHSNRNGSVQFQRIGESSLQPKVQYGQFLDIRHSIVCTRPMWEDPCSRCTLPVSHLHTHALTHSQLDTTLSPFNSGNYLNTLLTAATSQHTSTALGLLHFGWRICIVVRWILLRHRKVSLVK